MGARSPAALRLSPGSGHGQRRSMAAAGRQAVPSAGAPGHGHGPRPVRRGAAGTGLSGAVYPLQRLPDLGVGIGLAHVSLRTQHVCRAFDVKLNDVVLAIGAAGRLRGAPVGPRCLPADPLIARSPFDRDSARDGGGRGGRGYQGGGDVRVMAPTSTIPWKRLAAIDRSTTSGKTLRQELTDAHEINLTDTTPPALIRDPQPAPGAWRGWDAKTPPVFNSIISNVVRTTSDLVHRGSPIARDVPDGAAAVRLGHQLHRGLERRPARCRHHVVPRPRARSLGHRRQDRPRTRRAVAAIPGVRPPPATGPAANPSAACRSEVVELLGQLGRGGHGETARVVAAHVGGTLSRAPPTAGAGTARPRRGPHRRTEAGRCRRGPRVRPDHDR